MYVRAIPNVCMHMCVFFNFTLFLRQRPIRPTICDDQMKMDCFLGCTLVLRVYRPYLRRLDIRPTAPGSGGVHFTSYQLHHFISFHFTPPSPFYFIHFKFQFMFNPIFCCKKNRQSQSRGLLPQRQRSACPKSSSPPWMTNRMVCLSCSPSHLFDYFFSQLIFCYTVMV